MATILSRNQTRTLWGVTLQSGREEPTLLGIEWYPHPLVPWYDGEPKGTMLFTARRYARAWCAKKNAVYGAYPEGHVCRAWKFRAVRVEQVTTWKKGKS